MEFSNPSSSFSLSDNLKLLWYNYKTLTSCDRSMDFYDGTKDFYWNYQMPLLGAIVWG